MSGVRCNVRAGSTAVSGTMQSWGNGCVPSHAGTGSALGASRPPADAGWPRQQLGGRQRPQPLREPLRELLRWPAACPAACCLSAPPSASQPRCLAAAIHSERKVQLSVTAAAAAARIPDTAASPRAVSVPCCHLLPQPATPASRTPMAAVPLGSCQQFTSLRRACAPASSHNGCSMEPAAAATACWSSSTCCLGRLPIPAACQGLPPESNVPSPLLLLLLLQHHPALQTGCSPPPCRPCCTPSAMPAPPWLHHPATAAPTWQLCGLEGLDQRLHSAAEAIKVCRIGAQNTRPLPPPLGACPKPATPHTAAGPRRS